MPAEPTRLAIDLSGSVIRVVDGVMGGAMTPAAGPLPEGSWSRGKPADPAAVGRAIREVLARNAITGSRPLVAVSDEIGTFRVLSVGADDSGQQVAAAVARELALDPERLATRWVDVRKADGRRLVYAASWDRSTLKDVTDALKFAGLEAAVIELRSAALARTVAEPGCVILDLTSDPAEIVLIDESIPQLWHSFQVAKAGPDELLEALGGPLLSVIRFYQRKPGIQLGPSDPVLVSSEQSLPADVVAGLAAMLGRPVQALPRPPRVATYVRHEPYLACLGLMMRRDS